MPDTIGLLYDSASNNMGDQAIGLVLKRALAKHEIPHRVVNLFGDDVSDIHTLIVGGGEILRPAGDPFYDVFRVPGSHILNTAGLLAGADVSHLRDYRYLSVRSHADNARLGGRAHVSPCLSLLMGDYSNPEFSPSSIYARDAIGVHVNHGSVTNLAPLVQMLRNIGRPVLWLATTHYNADTELMTEAAKYVPGSKVIQPLSPARYYWLVSNLRAVVSSSLHLTLFAYANNVPVAPSGRIARKINAFMLERHLGQYLWHDADGAAQMLSEILNHPPDVSARLMADKMLARHALATIVEVAKRALLEPAEAVRISFANKEHHEDTMRTQAAMGAQAAHSNRISLARTIR